MRNDLKELALSDFLEISNSILAARFPTLPMAIQDQLNSGAETKMLFSFAPSLRGLLEVSESDEVFSAFAGVSQDLRVEFAEAAACFTTAALNSLNDGEQRQVEEAMGRGCFLGVEVRQSPAGNAVALLLTNGSREVEICKAVIDEVLH
jgi:hypothetical protein